MSKNNILESPAATGSIVDQIKALVSAGQINPTVRKSVKDVNPATGKLHTSKDKAVLGIDDDRIIVWAYPNFETTDREKFNLLAKAGDMSSAELASRIVMDWFEHNRAAVEPVVADQLKAENTADEIQAKIDAAMRQLAKLQAKMSAVAETGGDE